MALGERKDPYVSFLFNVKVDQKVVAGFNEVTGLEFETDVETFRQGGENLHEQQLAGPNKFPSRLVLKRGMTDVDALWSWHQEVTQGIIKRKVVSILLLDSTGAVKRSWNFREAVPVKWVGPQFRASNAEVAFETLELVHKGLVPG